MPFEMRKIGDRPFEGRLEAAEVGSLLLTRVTNSAVSVELNMSRRSHEDDALHAAIILSGTRGLDQGGRVSIAREGDLVLLDHKPAKVVTQKTGDTLATNGSLTVGIPRGRLEAMLGPAQRYTWLPVEAARASTSLVTTFFKELVRVGPRLDPASAERMASIGVDLLVASVAERLAQEVPKPLHGTIVLQRAKAYIEANLGDPTLDPPHLAAAMGVSLRRLQELFHEHGRHISEWIWQRRLEVAATRLADPGCRHLPIGSLAYGCGFSHQAHFSRRFRDRFGMTPGEYRQSVGLNSR